MTLNYNIEEVPDKKEKKKILGITNLSIKGIKGDTGEQGIDGKDGIDGIKGVDGVNGAIGEQGPIGPIGERGEGGKDGVDGLDGKDGKDGKDGTTKVVEIVEKIKKLKKDEKLGLEDIRGGKEIRKEVDNMGLWTQTHDEYRVDGVKIASGKVLNLKTGTGVSISGLPTADGADITIANTQSGAEWGQITGTLSNQTDLQTALNAKKTDSMNTDRLLGRGTVGVGAIEEIILGTNLSLSGNTLNAAASAGANPSVSVGLTAVNGVATTFLRSDGSPALSQAIAPTWTARHTYQPTANGIAWQINTTAGVSRIGYNTSLSQLYIGDTGGNGSLGLINIVDLTHSFKDAITITKYTWGSGISIGLSTLSPVIKATGGSTFVSYTVTDTGTYFSNAANNGGTLSMRVDNDNYWTAGLYVKGFNNNSAPSSGRCRSYGLYAQAQGHASGNGGATFFGEIQAPNIDGIRIQVAGSQTAPILRAYTGNYNDSSATINTNTFFEIDGLGAIKPASLADASASNNRVYYSTTASKLVYKDAAGVVNNLY